MHRVVVCALAVRVEHRHLALSHLQQRKSKHATPVRWTLWLDRHTRVSCAIERTHRPICGRKSNARMPTQRPQQPIRSIRRMPNPTVRGTARPSSTHATSQSVAAALHSAPSNLERLVPRGRRFRLQLRHDKLVGRVLASTHEERSCDKCVPPIRLLSASAPGCAVACW